jgi:hypothetical protein
MSSLTNVGDQEFLRCAKLVSVDLSSAKTLKWASLEGCTSLQKIDLPKAESIASSAFNACSKLTTVILRNSEKICSLGATNAFTNTPIASGTGYIYVPRDLVDAYKTATNWSTYANQFRTIEDYPEICEVNSNE